MKLTKENVQNKFIERIEELSGENIYACYQCGRCSAGCPLVEHMDILPNQIIHLLQLGKNKKVLDSETIWFCSTCLQCMAKCPKGVDLAKIMDSLREVLRREGVEKIELTKIANKMWQKIPQQALVSAFRKYSS